MKLLAVAIAGVMAIAHSLVDVRGAKSPDAATHDHCVRPSAVALLGRDIPGLEFPNFFPVRGATPGTRWATVSWGGPLNGALFVVDCGGRVIAENKKGLGYFDSLSDGPAIDGRRTVEVIYVPGTGTGIQLQSIAILSFDGAAISILWDHARKDDSTFPDNNGWRTESNLYKWRFETSGTRIRVAGTQSTGYDGGRMESRKLPDEFYCYRKSAHRFIRC